jgi:hypothetical protein
MTDYPQNPRRSQMLYRVFEKGAVGHVFSRPLTKAEVERLELLMNDGNGGGHGGIIFFDGEGVARGAHLCQCAQTCQAPLLQFVADTGVGLKANLQGDFNYEPTNSWTGPNTRVEISQQTVSGADEIRIREMAIIAVQVSEQVMARVMEQARAASAAQAKPRPRKRWGPHGAENY